MTAANSTGPRRTRPAATAAEPMTLAFEVQVTAVQELSPNFRRITFGGYSLRRLRRPRQTPWTCASSS